MSIKTIVTLSLITLTYWVSHSQNTFIPDNNFEQVLIDLGLDSGPLDNWVPTANISGITNLEINNKNISDLTGIEDFVALTYLSCEGNNLANLNITQNTNLAQLYCRSNQLTILDTSLNTNLSILWVQDNLITDLNLINNINLISLITDNNPLNDLDVTNNINLNVFSCENNQLANLDVTKNVSLSYLNVNYNYLTDLNISKNTELLVLTCGDNIISSLDLTKNTKLLTLFCARIPISSLDVTKNILLESLTFSETQIASLDLSMNTQLKTLWCLSSLLTDLDLSNNIMLESLQCDLNNITSLDLSNNKNLREFSATSNKLCYLNVKNKNNSTIARFNTTNNPNLSCIFVDTITYSTTNWANIDATSNFITTQAECDAFGNGTPDVDILNDFVGTSYTLPLLTNGNYFTEINGNGSSLQPGDIITSSQTIYIFNETLCYNNESHFNVIINDYDYYIPKFFTPNNDGSHDLWNVQDFTNTIKTITIYDRYGKLLKLLPPNSGGWNGTYRGQLMESNDYWYVITLNSGEIVKGHFSLKR